MADKPTIAIIGAGKVGTALGALAGGCGYTLAAVADVSPQAAEAAAERTGATVHTAEQAAGAGQLVLLTVPDDQIGGLCDELASAGAFSAGAVVAHCSGALGSDMLSAAKHKCTCRVASCHPLQTFPTVEAAMEKIPGATFFIEGDPEAAEVLERLAADLGGRAVRISTQAKVLYHAAAVMACNYLTALLDAAAATAEQTGVDRDSFLEAAEPLVRATVDNVFSMGPAAALTGPIERGDAATIRRHLSSLRDCPAELEELYRAAGMWTVDLARRKGRLKPADAEALRELLRKAETKE